MVQGSEAGGGLATASLPKKCDDCHEGSADLPIGSEDGETLEICEACDKRLFGTDLTEVEGIIIEALEDYRCWWCDEDETDKEKRQQIDRAIEVMKNLM